MVRRSSSSACRCHIITPTPISSSFVVDARPPIIQGPGAKPGTVPTDLEQSTGIERFEILARMEGHDPFDRKPLAVNHMGTLDNPVKVFSLVRPLKSFRIILASLPNRSSVHPTES